MNENQFYGWFDNAQDAVPTYDPPHGAPCPFCGTPITPDDVRTHCMMYTAPSYAKRSYFYRTHRTCAVKSAAPMDDFILDMIRRNHD